MSAAHKYRTTKVMTTKEMIIILPYSILTSQHMKTSVNGKVLKIFGDLNSFHFAD